MTRAVIKLKRDIAYTMPIMDRVIDGCASNNVTPIASFRYKNFGVIVYRREITVNGAGDEASALEVVNFLKDIVNNSDNITEKVSTY